MNVIITGATGMVGKGVLLECLDHPLVQQVLTISRSLMDINHEKLIQIEHKDFSSFENIKHYLAGYDACYLCMGVSVAGMSEERYKEITYDYTMALAKTLFDLNPNMTITYVSGQITDSTEKSRTMWARIKGKTENDLLKIGFPQAYMFRPGGIIPLRGIRSKTKSYQIFYEYFMWFIKIIKFLAPNSIVNTTQIGKAMIIATMEGYNKNIISPEDIIQLSKTVSK